MRRLDKWQRLPAGRLGSLPEAMFAVALVRLWLRFLSLRTWEHVADSLTRRRPPSGSAQAAAEDVAWAVRRASRFVPGATCLTQALAAQLVLSRRGYVSRLRIGVAHAPAGGLRAHAWLESDGRIVLGGDGRDTFTSLERSEETDARRCGADVPDRERALP